MTRKSKVCVGDRFAKVGTMFSRVFTVMAVIEQPGRPPHVILSVSPGASAETVTLAVAALMDTTLFRRL